MPSWGLHLAISKKICDKYKINKNLFYFSSLLPDTNYDWNYKRIDSHFYSDKHYSKFKDEYVIDIDKFINEYRNVIKDDFVLGYLTHLMTDYYFNTYFFDNYFVVDDKGLTIGIKTKRKIVYANSNKRKDIKHKEFDKYSKYIYNNLGIDKLYYEQDLLNKSKLIKENLLTKERIIERINYINNDLKKQNKLTLKEKIFGFNYKVMDRKEFDKLFDDCLRFVSSKLDSLDIEKY